MSKGTKNRGRKKSKRKIPTEDAAANADAVDATGIPVVAEDAPVDAESAPDRPGDEAMAEAAAPGSGPRARSGGKKRRSVRRTASADQADQADQAGDDRTGDNESPVETAVDHEVDVDADRADETDHAPRTPDDDSDEPTEITTESVVEAVLFATDTPLSSKKIAQILGVGTAGDVKKHIDRLNRAYAKTGRSFRIEEIAKGYQMLTLPAYNNWLKQVLRIREETKLSRAAMETLAIVAYKQPILRADVEAIRGVAAGEMINRLREMELVKIVGRAEELGRPILYGTTKKFLEVFGLAALEDLPKSEELAPPPSPAEAEAARIDDGGQDELAGPAETTAETTGETTADASDGEAHASS